MVFLALGYFFLAFLGLYPPSSSSSVSLSMNRSETPICLKRALAPPDRAAFLIPPVDLGFFALMNGLGGMGG